MYKNIKYLIEDLQKFDVSEYNDSNDIVNDQDITNISYDCPKTIDELIDIITDRIYRCDFNEFFIEPDMTGIDLRFLTSLNELFSKIFDKLSYVLRSNKVKLDLTSWNITNITNLSEMFYNCYEINSINLSGWNTSNVNDMSNMFDGCNELKELNLSGWDTSNVTNMSNMFKGCEKLNALDLSNWDTSNVEDMSNMFKSCKSLQFLDIQNFSGKSLLLNEYIIYSIFEESNIKELKIPKDFFNILFGYKINSIKLI